MMDSSSFARGISEGIGCLLGAAFFAGAVVVGIIWAIVHFLL